MKSKIIFRLSVTLALAILMTGTYWYYFTPKYYYVRLPVTFSNANIPLMEMEIAGNTYSVEVDLGSKFPLALSKDLLGNLEKKPTGTATWRDAKGNSYESPSYSISKINLGSFVLTNVAVKEEREDFINSTTVWREKTTPAYSKAGSIGRPLLEKTNLLLDFPHSAIIATNSTSHLKNDGFNIEGMLKVPFEMGRTGMILHIETDIGTVKFSIDTGSSATVIRSDLLKNHDCKTDWRGLPFFTTSSFKIGGKEYGSLDLYPYELTPELNELDGFLGMDFLQNHVVYIDYPNKVVYFGK